MIEALQFIATLCTAIFAGAALYINLVEHPARLTLDTAAALDQWAPSYRRATFMQAPLAIVACLSSALVWLVGGGASWLLAAALIGAVVPFTFLVIMPTNNSLLAMRRSLVSDGTRALLRRWGVLHGVRTTMSLIATVLMLWSLRGA